LQVNKIIKSFVNHFYRPFSPIEVILYLTNNCNLKCKFCDIGISNIKNETHPHKELSISQLDKIVEAMITMKVKDVYITGGEPFMAHNLWYLLDLCYRNSLVISAITTNGSTLNTLSNEQIIILNRANIRRIIISVDYPDANRQDNFRGKAGLFHDIELFMASKKSEAIKTNYCLSTVISKQNYKDLSALIKWAVSLKKIRHINFQPVCIDPIFVDYKTEKMEKDSFYIDTPYLDELTTYISDALRTAKEARMSTTLPFLRLWITDYFKYAKTDKLFFKKIMKGFMCSTPYNYLHINYNGDILACTHIGPIENIEKGDIANIWKKAAEEYKKIFKSDIYFRECRNCFCDFGANYRTSLLYKPVKNIKHILRIAPYYIRRYLGKTI